MKKSYRIVTHKNSRGLADYLARNGQLLLPMVELIEASRMAIDELIDILGRASIDPVLELSARSVAGEKRQGRGGRDILWYGSQGGRVPLGVYNRGEHRCLGERSRRRRDSYDGPFISERSLSPRNGVRENFGHVPYRSEIQVDGQALRAEGYRQPRFLQSCLRDHHALGSLPLLQ